MCCTPDLEMHDRPAAWAAVPTLILAATLCLLTLAACGGPSDDPDRLVLARDQAGAVGFAEVDASLLSLPAEQRVQSIRYRVRPGDTLSEIALGSRTTVSRLRKLNQLESSRIIAGKLLIVPLHGHDGDTG